MRPAPGTCDRGSSASKTRSRFQRTSVAEFVDQLAGPEREHRQYRDHGRRPGVADQDPRGANPTHVVIDVPGYLGP
jgi:hypothetical protein